MSMPAAGSSRQPGRGATEEGGPPCADLTVSHAARVVKRALKEGLYGLSAGHGGPPPGQSEAVRSLHADPAVNTARGKDAAKRLGADVVGICRTDPDWLFAPNGADREVLPADGYGYAVVAAVAMERAAIEGSPGPVAAAATSVGYMRMAVCASGLSVFIRQHGYKAVAAGPMRALGQWASAAGRTCWRQR